MKQRLKGLLALVLSLTMVLGLMTCAWGTNYTLGGNVLHYDGKDYEPLQEGQLLFAGDVIIEDPYVSGGYFVIWNGTEYESLGSSNEVFYDDSSSQPKFLDPALYCEGSYTIPSGKYIFREFGEAFLNHNNQGTDPLYYFDTREGANYPVSYIHLVPVYTVTFDLQGYGTMTTATQTDIPKGDKVTEPNPAPSANGWTFGGWYKEAACTNAYDFNSAVNSSFTLYAQWTENSSGDDPEQEQPYFPIYIAPVEEESKTVEAPETFDGGIASAVVVTILSATGGAWLAKKKD